MSNETHNHGKSLAQALTEMDLTTLLNTLDAHAIVSITDVSGAITYVNDKFCQISGYAREELIGENHRLLKSDGYSKVFFRDLWRTIASGKTWHGVFRDRRKDGKHYWVQSSIAPILGANGKPRSYIAIRTDVSGHYRAIATLQEFATTGSGKDFYFKLARALARALGVRWAGIGQTCDGGRRVRMLGYCADGQAAPLESYALAGTPCESACTQAQPVTIEHGVTEQYPDDEVLQRMGAVSYRGEPLTTADGEGIGVLWAIDDRVRPEHPGERTLLLTCAQRASEEIQRQQAAREIHLANRSMQQSLRAQRVFSRVNHLVIHAKNETALLNDVCQAVVDVAGYRMAWVGYRRDDAARSIEPVAQAGYSEGYLEGIQFTWAKSGLGTGPGGEVIRTGRTQVVDDVSKELHKFGFDVDRAQRQGFRSLLALPLMKADRAFGLLSVQSVEINAFHREEIAMLEEMAADLSFGILHLRAQREKKRLQTQLRQAQKMESVGELTAGIAHDFNNILAIIMGNADLALNAVDDPDNPQQGYLEHIETASARARDLIEKLMVFSRSDPAAENAAARCEPQRILQQTLEMLRGTLPSSLEFQTSIVSEAELSCHISADALQQSLTNIIINARDAMHGSGTLCIDLRRVSAECTPCASCHHEFTGEFVRISLRDTGCGMSSDILGQVFQPFFSTKEVGEGTGLGLSMVHGIMHRRGGHITLASQPGQGTTINLYLAIAGDDEETHTPDENPADTRYPALEGKRVLVVDDETALTTLYADWLLEHGMQVVSCNDSRAALSHLSQHISDIDLLLTDQTMPGLSGLDLARAAQQLRPDLRVLICSGYGEDIEQLAENRSHTFFLKKPFGLKQLLAALHDMV